ncbi:hypothetical protein [Pseudodesulfovibrio tunisiensis]|uniref:hypothetical protein n=1 Tax=Pseudodesulfovibrio tunisiensis TaxID=463192 RepID=UPI001FB1ABCA|nr:hypothetical protein [Pseudodesulfovibrio tunisiensis]
MARKRKSASQEKTRNILLALLALTMLGIFFSLDLTNRGESMFSREASRKIRFLGDLQERDYTSREVSRLLRYVKRHNGDFRRVLVTVSVQDSYRKVTPDSEMLFEVRVELADGSSLETPVRRATRRDLMDAILAKLDKDVRAYETLRRKGTTGKSLINTM